MTKSYGANIRCAFPGCGAEPHPSDPNIRETFSLTRLGPDGYPSNDPTIGEWRCEMHPIPRSDPLVKQSTRTTPPQALADFEADFGIEIADLEEEASVGRVGATMIARFRQRIERSLATLRKVLSPPEPSPVAAPKSRAKKIQLIERLAPGQEDWISGTVETGD